MKIIKIFLCSLTIILSSCADELPNVIPFTQFNRIDTTRTSSCKFRSRLDNYIIQNYNEHLILFADSIAERNYPRDVAKYEHYSMAFYKASTKTDTTHLREHPADFNNFSNTEDLVYVYKWSNGKYIGRDLIKDGKVVDLRVNIKKYDR